MVAKITDTRHVLFEEMAVKWCWYESELLKFIKMWNEGASILEIAKEFRTNQRSIALLIMDQAELGHIKQRDKGLFGN